ncbi:MAG: 2-C-methyl-D-erythritol 2,4-cyclodiphosphate synthase [Spirochaetes bacterium]|nr:2-C-methyl-D-erythritol 2,4-cyclodiphosphate synthase [Spirochaetota bacterium]MBN2771707.1 2-C-methyl-D-erythritol 2,4-cyclodiphosphate synthase [Spirochaetota bacterium]
MIRSLRCGTGFDVHRFCQDRDLVLGGVVVKHPLGLAGHSDADVLVHALMDALLGAAALPDIGSFFPDNDVTYQNISSIVLLQKVKSILNESGFEIINIDTTIICEKPKVGPYIALMKKKIGNALEVSEDLVGIKATTTEKLGFTGREEGIACQAAVLLFKKTENKTID